MRRYLLLIIPFLLVTFCGLYIYIRPYYTPAKKLSGLSINTHHDDTIRIAYIGDSWAEKHQFFDCIIDSMVSSSIHKPVLVRISGVGGLTSKEIYNGIFRNESMRSVIEWGPDFCFVVAGINDTDRKKGRGYYKESMRLIIESLLDNKIIPIILEIPSYDILSSYKRKKIRHKLRYVVLTILARTKIDCIDEYRSELSDLLKDNHWESKVIVIHSNDWNPDGYRDRRGLYNEDLMHLNERGYMILDSCISRHIINNLDVQSK